MSIEALARRFDKTITAVDKIGDALVRLKYRTLQKAYEKQWRANEQRVLALVAKLAEAKSQARLDNHTAELLNLDKK